MVLILLLVVVLVTRSGIVWVQNGRSVCEFLLGSSLLRRAPGRDIGRWGRDIDARCWVRVDGLVGVYTSAGQRGWYVTVFL